jgi:hypothetical protein
VQWQHQSQELNQRILRGSIIADKNVLKIIIITILESDLNGFVKSIGKQEKSHLAKKSNQG